jgi:ABC-type lipoprotein release transport system permease subunit
MKYKSVIVTKRGGPDVLQVIENELREPAAREARIKVLAAPMPAVYGISGILAWLIFTLFLATIASAFPARRASRLTVRDTLAYE